MARPPPPRIIKKYSNRRLYDTSDSRYVTLDEVARTVRSGVDIRVLDAATSADLTQATLTQIILEGRGAAQFLSVALLTQLIRMSDDALAEFLGRYLTGALELYLQARHGAQSLAPYAPFATAPFVATNAMARLLAAIAPWGGPSPSTVPHSPSPSYPPEVVPADVSVQAPADSERVDAIEDLRREIDELKKSLRPSHAKSTPRTRR